LRRPKILGAIVEILLENDAIDRKSLLDAVEAKPDRRFRP